MPVNADFMELISILAEEGFEALAGELLNEVATGRELREPGDDGSAPYGITEGQADQDPQVQPIPDGEQLGYAMRLLRLRLVEPVRRLAEAEQVAGRIRAEGGGAAAVQPVQIVFTPVVDGAPLRMDRQAAPGDQTDADELAQLLVQIASEVI